jgi:hypothetical protein
MKTEVVIMKIYVPFLFFSLLILTSCAHTTHANAPLDPSLDTLVTPVDSVNTAIRTYQAPVEPFEYGTYQHPEISAFRSIMQRDPEFLTWDDVDVPIIDHGSCSRLYVHTGDRLSESMFAVILYNLYQSPQLSSGLRMNAYHLSACVHEPTFQAMNYWFKPFVLRCAREKAERDRKFKLLIGEPVE